MKPRKTATASLPSLALLLVAVLFFDAGAAAEAAGAAELLPLPRPDLSGMEAPIRRGIETLQAEYEALRRRPGVPAAELAMASGRLGGVYHAHGQRDAAEVCYRNARELTPRDPRWAYYLGFLYRDMGRLDEAAANFADVLAERPDDLATLVRAGNVELDRDRPEAARAFFERALAASPGEAAALFGLGKVAAARGDAPAAAARFEEVLALQPAASIVHYPLALAYRQLGEVERARQHLAARGDAEVDFPDPLIDQLSQIILISALNVVLSLAADDEAFSPRDFLGFAVTRLGDKDGTVEYLEEAVRQRDGPGSERQRARIHFAIAGLLSHRQDETRALEHLRAAVRLAPDFTAAQLDLAEALTRAGQHAEARAAFDAVLAHDPASTAALTGRSTAAVRLGDDAAAVPDLRRLVELQPEEGRPRLHLAMVLQHLRQKDEAAQRYREALERGLDAAGQTIAHGNLALLAQERGELAAAATHLETALQLDPESPRIEFRLAEVLALSGRYGPAAEHYAAVAAAEPENEAARLGEVSALILAERFAGLGERLEAAHRALPGSAVLAHLFARFLAAAPDPAARDGARALALAQPLFDRAPTLLHGETLAMALAGAGRFADAAELQGRLLAAAEERGATETAARLRGNLARYAAGEACCVESGHAVLLPTVEEGSGS